MTIAFLSHLDLNLYLFRLPIMQKLVEQGHMVYAVCPKGIHFHRFEEHGIEAVAYEIQRSSLDPFKELKAIYNIYQAIKPLKLDMLHTFTAKPNIYGTIAGKVAGVPTVINLVEGLGSFYIEDTVKNRFMRRVIEILYKMVFSYSDKVVFVNSEDPAYLEQTRVIKRSQVKIIKSVGIDTDVFNPLAIAPENITALKNSLDLQDKIIVLMVGRAIWHKGVREFYEAAEHLSAKKVKFVLIGDIDEGNPSSADRAFLENGHVLWLGHRDDILELTAMCDIYVLPSYREGVPRTLLEAASMAKPIVTTDTVGCREVVEDGFNGLLIPVKDTQKLVEKIEYLVTHPEKRKIMGEHGRIRAIEMFDMKQVVAQYMVLYAKLNKERA